MGTTTERWFATRSGLNARTDEDRAMAHEQEGPFGSRELARTALATIFRDGVRAALEGAPGSVARDFGPQYLDLLTALATHPGDDHWTVQGVQWRLWRADQPAEAPEPRKVVALPAAAPTPVTVALNVSELSPRMREALTGAVELAGGQTYLRSDVLVGTSVALIRRDLVTPGNTHYLTPAGLRARARLAELAEAGAVLDGRVPVADYVHAEVPEAEPWSHARALGYLEQFVEYVLKRGNLSDASARELREALAEVQRHCPTREG